MKNHLLQKREVAKQEGESKMIPYFLYPCIIPFFIKKKKGMGEDFKKL
jgi:hypothetical protein